MLDIDQLNGVINIQWDRNDIVSVEVAVQNTCRNGITIQTNQEIKEGLHWSLTTIDFLWYSCERISSEK